MISARMPRPRKKSAQQARLAGIRRASLYAGRTKERTLAPWRSAPARAEPPTAARPRTEAASAWAAAVAAAAVTAVALAEPLALRACALLVLVAALAHGPDGEVHAAHPVDLGDLHLHLVADLHEVLDASDAVGRDLGSAHEALLAGEVLHERADAHDPCDLPVEDLADLGLLRDPLDHRDRLRATLRLGTGDAHRPVVLDLDARVRLTLDRADHLAAGADDLADLVRMDLDRVDARRVLVQLAARPVDDLAHRVEDEDASLTRLREGLAHDLERDALHLDVHLQRGDPVLRAADLEVHVAVVVLEALDVGEDRVLPLLHDEAHRDAPDHLGERDARVHQRQRRAARRCHGGRPVRLERL